MEEKFIHEIPGIIETRYSLLFDVYLKDKDDIIWRVTYIDFQDDRIIIDIRSGGVKSAITILIDGDRVVNGLLDYEIIKC